MADSTGHDSSSRPLMRDPRLYTVFGITLIGVMGVSSITPAFPQIGERFGLTSAQVGLLLTVFTVPGIVLAPALGFLADRVGRKRIVVPALLTFGLAGAGCAIAPGFPALLVLRFFQGAGAASLTSLSVTLLGDIYRGDRRERAVGYNASALSIGTAAFPVVGGALAGIGWRFPFLLPLAAIPIGLVVLYGFETPPFEARRGGEQLRAVLQNARREGIIGLSLLAVLVFILLYGAYLSYLPFLLEERFDASPALIGIIMSAMSLTTAAVASQRGAVARRVRTPVTLTIALVCYTASLILFPLMPVVWLVMAPTLLYGVAQGLTIPTIQSQIAARAPTELRGATVAANGMAIRLGQTLGPLLAGMVAAAAGSSAVFWTGAAVPVIMLAVVWTMEERERPRRRKDP